MIFNVNWVSTDDLVIMFLCPQAVSDFEPEIDVDGLPGHHISVSSGSE